MRVLWLVNTIFPYPSQKLGLEKNVFGGWLTALFANLLENKEIKLAIATVYDGVELKKYVDSKTETIYYLIPYKNRNKYDEKSISYFKQIDEEFKPNLTHIHGSEFPFTLVYQDHTKVKTLLSIQGLISSCANYYLANLTMKDILKNITIRDILRFDTIYNTKYKWLKKSKYEIDLIKKVNYITGRTTWDYANTYKYCLQNKYFYGNETLRDSFYKEKWDLAEVHRHTIFISQASYPLKGFHIVLQSISLLKKKYPDILVCVAGSNILKEETIQDKIRRNGYTNYLINLIKELKLEKNIKFLGLLNEDEMVLALKQANVFVQASSIENSSNSLGEAMIIGMPIVASNVGGTSDLLIDRKEGLLYQFGEYALLAKYIDDIFSNDKLAISLGKNARSHALKTHNKENNTRQMVNIYKEIMNETSKKNLN